MSSPSVAPLYRDALDRPGRRWVEETLASLTLRERIGQLVMPWIPGSYAATSDIGFRTLERWVTEEGIGGVVISIGSPHSYASLLNRLQNLARAPLLVTADFENGGPGMRVNHSYALPTLLPQGGGTSFPPTMAFGAIGDPGFAYEYGRITALEARALGVHLNFAPVLDVNSNPENPIINTRAFGEDPEEVARLGAAYIEGARAGGVLTTAKHFPGHGDTRTDSHIDLPVVTADRGRLEAVELVPFREAVEAGVDAVMTAHVSVPAILGEGAVPATLSSFFLTGLLREEMGFGGLVFTDALRMGAISRGYGAGEAAVLALEAGSDVLLAPEQVGATIDAVEVAVRTGHLSSERIDASVRRLLTAKARTGLDRRRTVDLAAVAEVAGAGEHVAFADRAAERSVTLVRDRDGLVPLPKAGRGRVASITYARSRDLVAGLEFDRVAAAFVDELVRLRIDEGADPATYRAVQAAAQDADLVLLNVFVPPFAGAGSVGVSPALRAMVQALAGRAPIVVSSFGNPYFLSGFDDPGTFLIAWGSHEVSQRAGAYALMGATPISGTLPISIPPHHHAGEGLEREALPGPAAVKEVLDRVPSWVTRPLGPDTPTAMEAGLPDDAQVSTAESEPEAAGMSGAVLEALDRRILTAISDSVTPGAALAIVRRGRLVRLRGYGRLDWDPTSPAVVPSSIYDLASVTKVMAATTAALMLVEEERLELEVPVVRYLPWWSGGQAPKEAVTLQQLLLHRGGLPPFRQFFFELEGREAFQQAVAQLPLDTPPGESTVYSDIGMMTVAWVVEEITGEPLDAFLRARVWEPLGMQDTGFSPDSSLFARIAPTEVDTVFRHTHVRGVVHDENAFAVGGVAGHAGLFSSARDAAVFAAMMLAGGEIGPCGDVAGVACSLPRPNSVRIADPSLVERFTRRHDERASRAVGWDTPSGNSSAGRFLTRRAFGHTGFTGPSIWIDPELDLAVVLLMNRVNPTRENTRHIPLRREVHDLAAQAITDREVVPRPP